MAATANATVVTGAKTALIKLTNATEEVTLESKSALLPGEEIFKDQTITLNNGSTRDIYVFATISATFGDKTVTLGADDAELIVTLTGWNPVTGHDGVYSTTATGTDDIVVKVSATLSNDLAENNDQKDNIADDAHEYMNQPITVTFKFMAAQKDGVTDAKAAYEAWVDNTTPADPEG